MISKSNTEYMADKPDKKIDRPEWDRYFMEIAELVSRRSTCLSRRVGAVVVKDRRILATGYNGSPRGLPHCIDIGCLRRDLNIPSGQQLELCRGSHAEENAIVQAASYGIPLEGSMIYCNLQPCLTCTKMIINSGIKHVVFAGDYPHPMSLEIMHAAGLRIDKYDPEKGFTAPVTDDGKRGFLTDEAANLFRARKNGED
jgi:dCMP deaminase